MDSLSTAVITSVSHGYTETLLKTGLKAEWIDNADARLVYETATSLLRSNKPVNALSVLVAADKRFSNVSEVKQLFSLNGTGDVSAETVVVRIKDHHLLNQTNALISKVQELAKNKPEEVGKWLPVVAARMQALNLGGRAYDAKPSAHLGPVVAPVMFKSTLCTYNQMFAGNAEDGGGYRAGWWTVWVGVSGRGKTTHGYTLGCDAVRQSRRVTYIAKENQRQVSARLLLGLTYLTLDEINQHKAKQQAPILDERSIPVMVKDSEGAIIGEWHDEKTRQYILDSWMAALDVYVRIYNWREHFLSTSVDGIIGNVRNVIAWDDPDLVMLDYIGPEDVPGNADKKYGLGEISAGCEDVFHSSAKNGHGFFQMSNAEAAAYQKNPRHEVAGPYGSGSVKHSADQFFQTRMADMPYEQTVLRSKCRASGPIEEYKLAYDRARWVYIDLPQNVPININI